MLNYKQLQTEKYKSFESDHQQWRKGQERFIHMNFLNLDHNLKILDLGCGDGVGLMYFRLLGFHNVTGVEFCAEKAEKARRHGYPVSEIDMHNLSTIYNESMDVVYSSHSLEHTWDPIQVLENIHRILKPGGTFFLVLPYPDTGPEDAHCGKLILQSHLHDNAESLGKLLMRYFTITKVVFDSYRESEVWFTLTKKVIDKTRGFS
jgi:SAM-dependent methyltransferase